MIQFKYCSITKQQLLTIETTWEVTTARNYKFLLTTKVSINYKNNYSITKDFYCLEGMRMTVYRKGLSKCLPVEAKHL